MSPVDLVQYPHSGRKTGELVVSGPDGDGRLFYEKGKPVHAIAGGHRGMDALVEILGWHRGEFQFRLGIEAEESTIDLDLHRALMQALKLRDERGQEAPEPDVEAELTTTLSSWLDSTPSALQAIVTDGEGEVVAAAHRGEDSGDAEALRKCLRELRTAYPRPNLRRGFLEDAAGIVVLMTLPSSRLLLVLSDDQAPLGAVARQTHKLADSLKEREA